MIARAYRALGGDIELLESIAEEVIEEAGKMNPFFGQRTAILTSIVDKIVDGERPIFRD